MKNFPQSRDAVQRVTKVEARRRARLEQQQRVGSANSGRKANSSTGCRLHQKKLADRQKNRIALKNLGLPVTLLLFD
jgi:hypothetical protein